MAFKRSGVQFPSAPPKREQGLRLLPQPFFLTGHTHLARTKTLLPTNHLHTNLLNLTPSQILPAFHKVLTTHPES